MNRLAKQIYDLYVANYATKQVNLNGPTTMEIQKVIKENEGKEEPEISKNLFTKAVEEAKYLLHTDCYSKFINSKQYEESKDTLRKIRLLTAPVIVDKAQTGLTAMHWKILTSDAKIQYYGDDIVITKEGDPSRSMYRLKRGVIELCSNRDDSLVSLGSISEPGAVFGELCVVGQSRSVSTIISKDPKTEIYVIDVSQFLSLLQSDNRLAVQYFKHLGNKLAMLLYKQAIDGVVLNEKDWKISTSFEPKNEKKYRDDDLFVYARNNFPEIPSNELPVKCISFYFLLLLLYL